MSNKPLHHILYAEDEEDIREIAKIALEDLGGFQVTYCSNGDEVLDAINRTEPDLLLLDVMMPAKDGPSTLKEIRNIEKYKSLPAIFMTAKIQSDEIDVYKGMGALDVIAKPFDPMNLADLIKRAWDKMS
jgi:two-component system OmpR family response regulator